MNSEAVVGGVEKEVAEVVVIGDRHWPSLPRASRPSIHCESAVFISHFPTAVSIF